MKSAVLYYGSEETLPEQLTLWAGPLSLLFENGDLRTIRCAEHEVLRRVYVAVRDRNWNTIPAELSDVQVSAAERSFRITFHVRNRQGDVDFAWNAVITGHERGTVSYTMDGMALSTFMRNRIGFCVLHPLRECAGRPCRVQTTDGTVLESRFPEYISPHQPFKDIRAISHHPAEGLEATVSFDGEVFEMEDQRNWTDASFKTYCTPLALPFPVLLEQGTRIRQSVTLTLRGSAERPAPERRTVVDAVAPAGSRPSSRGIAKLPVEVSVEERSAAPLPGIGLEASEGTLSSTEIRRLEALNLSHLRVTLQLFEPAWRQRLVDVSAQASALDLPLEVALFLSDQAESELAEVAGVLAPTGPPVARWLISHVGEKSTRRRWVELARSFLGHLPDKAPIGGGTDAYFAELNREPPPVEAVEFVCYSMNPQVHAFDNLSLAETLEAQGATVESARRFSGGLPILVTPVTLKPRYNPNATGPEPELGPDSLPPQVDRRQMSLFGAGWTAGSLSSLGESGIQSVTYYETLGWRGVMERQSGSPNPELFPSIPGAVFPVYHVLADVGEFRDGDIVPTACDDPLAVIALALSRGTDRRLILANLTGESRQVSLEGLSGRLGVRVLDERNAEAAMVDPEAFRRQTTGSMTIDAGTGLTLLPYATACIDTLPAGGRRQNHPRQRRAP